MMTWEKSGLRHHVIRTESTTRAVCVTSVMTQKNTRDTTQTTVSGNIGSTESRRIIRPTKSAFTGATCGPSLESPNSNTNSCKRSKGIFALCVSVLQKICDGVHTSASTTTAPAVRESSPAEGVYVDYCALRAMLASDSFRTDLSCLKKLSHTCGASH